MSTSMRGLARRYSWARRLPPSWAAALWRAARSSTPPPPGQPTHYAELLLVSGCRYFGGDTTLFGAFADVTPDDRGAGLMDAEYQLLHGDSQPRTIGEFDHLVQQKEPHPHGRAALHRARSNPSRDQWLTAGSMPAEPPPRETLGPMRMRGSSFARRSSGTCEDLQQHPPGRTRHTADRLASVWP